MIGRYLARNVKQVSVMKNLALSCSVVAAAALLGCAAEPSSSSIDISGDIFGQDADGKGDSAIAGVSENSFDAFGVLNAAASLDRAGLVRELGVSAAIAKKIDAAQDGGGFGRVGLPSLKALVRVGKLQPAQITKLLTYARSKKLVPTSAVKIPLMNQSGEYLYKLNGAMKTAHLPFFSKYMYSWDGAAGISQYTYFSDLGNRASEHDLDGEPSTGAGLTAGDGAGTLCYLGDKLTAVEAVRSGVSTLWSEQLSIVGWRAGTKQYVDEQVTEAELLDLMSAADQTAWKNFDRAGSDVLISSTISDGGDDPAIDMLAKCR